MLATRERPVANYTRPANASQPWPLLLVTERDARAMLGIPASQSEPSGKRAKCIRDDDLKHTVVRLVKSIGRRQRPEEGGVRCFVVADDGTVAGVLQLSRRQLGFVLSPHPRLTADVLDTGSNASKYRSRLLELLDNVKSLDQEVLNEQLQNVRVQAAARIVGGDDDRANHVLHEEVQRDNTEFFTPTDDPSISIGRWEQDVSTRGHKPSVADQLLASYDAAALAHISYDDELPLPDGRKLVPILNELQAILYPGFHGPRPNEVDFEAKLRGRLARLRTALTKQIRRALRFQHGSDEVPVLWEDHQYDDWALEKTDAFLAELPRIRWALAQDVEAALRSDPSVSDHREIVLAYPGVYAVTVYRLAHALARLGVPLLPRLMSEYAHSKTGIDIHPQATIAPGFFIDHGTGVVVGQTSKIGNNCTLYQGVTLGATSFPRDDDGNLVRGAAEQRHPTLEDNVVVYANATVLGGDTVVGMNSIVGGNVWLTHSLPSETIASHDGRPYRTKERPALVRAKLDNRSGI